jgi:hypothetical protein
MRVANVCARISAREKKERQLMRNRKPLALAAIILVLSATPACDEDEPAQQEISATVVAERTSNLVSDNIEKTLAALDRLNGLEGSDQIDAALGELDELIGSFGHDGDGEENAGDEAPAIPAPAEPGADEGSNGSDEWDDPSIDDEYVDDEYLDDEDSDEPWSEDDSDFVRELLRTASLPSPTWSPRAATQ